MVEPASPNTAAADSEQPGPIYIFAGGGTGGHLQPGLAVLAELQAVQPGARVVFACSDRPIDRRVLDDQPCGIVPQPARPLPRRPREAWGFLRAWRASRRLARRLLRDLRPAAVLGLGGFAAGPVVCQAARRGVPVGLLNPDAVPGKANRHLARRADAIFTQFEATAEYFRPSDRAKVRGVGCPVRPGLADGDRGEAMAAFGLDPGRKTLLVLGGSQGARSINQAVAALLAGGRLQSFVDAWQVLHIVGPGQEPAGEQSSIVNRQSSTAGASAASAAGPPVTRLKYCRRMVLAYAAADLAVCRGGAVTVAELAATGTPAVVLPYPYHADRQQRLNAEPLEKAGGAVILDDRIDPAANAAALAAVLPALLADVDRLAEVAAAARAPARANAAAEVARWLVEAAQRR